MRSAPKITGRQLQIMLAAIAEVESWDASHDSVASAPDGGWKFEGALPVPSRKLVKAVRTVEANLVFAGEDQPEATAACVQAHRKKHQKGGGV